MVAQETILKSFYKNITLTETDQRNILNLKNKYQRENNIEVLNYLIDKISKKFDVILYLHVLEHIEEDEKEIRNATEKLKPGGYLIVMAPAHQKIYGKLDKAVGHHRRYEKEFFERKFENLSIVSLKFLDSIGYILYYLNRIVFSTETFPSDFKIMIWDKIFTPLTIIIDFILGYKFGKCLVAVYKKNKDTE